MKSAHHKKFDPLFSTAVLFLFLITINLLAYFRFFRIDLTEDRLYSLSGPTIKLLSGLDDIVSIKCFFSSDLPPAYRNIEEHVRNILNDYKAYGGSRLNIEFLDPRKNSEYAQLAQTLGVPEIQMNILERDKVQAIKGYLGIGILYEDRKATIPVVNNISNLEYEITSGIKRVVGRVMPEILIGLCESEYDKQVMEKYRALIRNMEKQYQVRFINLAKEDVPEKAALLALIYPREITEIVRYRLDRYLASGGKLMLLLQVLEPNQMMFGTIVEHNLDQILAGMRMRIEPKLVYDRSCNLGTFRNGLVQFSLPYHLFIKIQPLYFSDQLPFFNRISSITLPWVAEIITDTRETSLTPVFSGTEFSGDLSGFNLDPQQNFHLSDRKNPVKIFGACFRGKYRSIYEKTPLSRELIASLMAQNPQLKTDEITITPDRGEAKAVVISNALFLTDDFVARHEGNLSFALNMVDWFTLGDDLTSIRAKGSGERPLFSDNRYTELYRQGKESSIERTKFFAKYLNLFLPPLIVSFAGLVRLVLRRRKRRLYELSLRRKDGYP
ncbi:MAG: Gldg family protein [Candidatus Wallbacteria bacterium]|nr:Gldg family protein [Candidatus Wallbacteria bacterium]